MKILVTGGAGFIGSHTAKKLIERGDEIVIADNFNDYYEPKLKRARIKILLAGLNFKLYEADVRDTKKMEEIFKEEKPDKVLHLASMVGVRYSLKEPRLYEEVNVRGTMNMLELAVKYKIKNFVYASSSSVYGGNKKLPFSESDPVDSPISPYAATKKSAEAMAHVYSHLYGLKTTGLRYFTVYGPWGRPDMAYFKFTKQIFGDKPIAVHNHGKMARDFTYISDIVEGTIKVLDLNLDREIINIGGDKEEELTRLIELIEKNLHKKAKRELVPIAKGEIVRTVADVRKLRALGWEPKVRLEEGIEKFVDWFREYYKISSQ